MSGQIRLERRGSVAWIVVDHPQRRNALTRAMWDELRQAAAEAAADTSLRVVIMRGAGDAAFVSGADISEFERLRTAAGGADYDRATERALEAVAAIDKPVVAMIHGACIGGGVALAVAADLRYAAGDAVFAVPAAALGTAYPPRAVAMLARTAGVPAAAEILFTARRYDAEEALRIGLVNALLPKPKLEPAVISLAERMADNAPLSLRAAKLALRAFVGGAAAAAADEAVRACFRSEDYAEGVRAFLEKRPPRFRGR